MNLKAMVFCQVSHLLILLLLSHPISAASTNNNNHQLSNHVGITSKENSTATTTIKSKDDTISNHQHHLHVPSYIKRQTKLKTKEPISAIKIKKKQKKMPYNHNDASSNPTWLASISLSQQTLQLLYKRTIPYLSIIRILSQLALGISTLSCLRTLGVPYVDSIWLELYGNTPRKPPPSGTFRPTTCERMLTQYSTLPPPFLPSIKPLIAFTTSLLIYVLFGVLLPKWFPYSYTKVLQYKQRHPAEQKQSLLPPDAILIHLPRDMRLYADHKTKMVCPLKQTEWNQYYFELCHQRYYYHPNNHTILFGGPNLIHSTIDSLVRAKGLYGKAWKRAKAEYGPYQDIQLPIPTMTQAFVARLASPMVVLQLFGKLMAALDDPTFTHTLFTLGQTLLHHYWNARQSIVSAQELASEIQKEQDNPTTDAILIRVKRAKSKWESVSANQLLPGDIAQLYYGNTTKMSPTTTISIPVDALLLKGSAITNEAVLTGESVAQSKVPLDTIITTTTSNKKVTNQDIEQQTLDFSGRHRSSILYAGTTLVHCPEPLTFLVLRTGSYSSRGDLLRALQRSRVGAISNAQTELDGMRLLASLSVAATLGCSWFWWNHVIANKAKTEVSTVAPSSLFRNILTCTRIILTAIPSDLPLALSSAAQTCAMRLKREADVVCSEPGSLLTASTIDHVLFDKTGTICSDTQAISHTENATEWTPLVLAGSNSIVQVDGNWIGDPLELASLRASNWTMEDSNTKRFVYTNDNKEQLQMWQIKTFPFDPNRRTSSSVVLVQHNDGSLKLYALVKGSPDSILNLLRVEKQDYNKLVSHLGRDGYRIVSLGIREITNHTESIQQLLTTTTSAKKPINQKMFAKIHKLAHKSNILHRDVVESGSFNFAGISCFEASIRPSSPRVVQQLKDAGIGVTMLTGDGIEVAISVANRCHMIPTKNNETNVAILDYNQDTEKLFWKQQKHRGSSTSRAKSKTSTISTRQVFSKESSFTFVATGNAVEALISEPLKIADECRIIKSRMQDFVVFARASPSQKVLVAAMLKENGKHVLMCGKLE
jgi:manganese-transporting P-type ATPase